MACIPYFVVYEFKILQLKAHMQANTLLCRIGPSATLLRAQKNSSRKIAVKCGPVSVITSMPF